MKKELLYQIIVFTINGETWKAHKTIINLKYLILFDEFELPDGSYSISDTQDYFEYILKKHNQNIDNPSIRTYMNKIENWITFKNITGYYIELLTRETMKLLGSTESKITNI